MITTRTFRTGPWGRSKECRESGAPPHAEPFATPGDPARLWTIKETADGPITHVQDWDGCRASVIMEVEMEREPDFSGRVPTNDDENSRAAADAMEGERAETVRRTVYRAIRRWQPIACWELEERIPMEHQSCSAAITWLFQHGHVYRDGKNRTRNNRSAHLYRIGPKPK